MVRDILMVCNGGNIISRIMFHTYISHSQAKAYLGEMIQTGLIERDPFDSRKYGSTPKGLAYLAALDNMADMLSIETRKARLKS